MSVSRRRLLSLGGAGVAGVTVGGAGAWAYRSRDDQPHPGPAGMPGPAAPVPFHGEHQAGIVTPAQDRLHFTAFDVVTDDRAELVALLQAWAAAAERITRGGDAGPVGAVNGLAEAPPDDTGEALGLPASGLTITVGFGPTLFETADGRDRFGLAGRRPGALADLPHFPGDALDPAISGGDLCVQACANDPQVAVHAVRNLARIGFGAVSVRWSQLGFGRTSATTRAQATPRNLMGFKDGTRNLRAEETELLSQHVWVPAEVGPTWMAGGTYLVARKIRMFIETWDRTPLAEQEAIFGRDKGEGAPLGRSGEYDEIDFELVGRDGLPRVATNAHIRLAHARQRNGARLLRRGYNYVDGTDELGRLAAGLFFVAFQRDPRRQFVPIQRALARDDFLNEYIQHVSSALFACPPGVREPGGYWGQALFE